MNEQDVTRFWSKVKRGTDEECWPWLGRTDKDGYGSFWLDGRNRRAHRVACALSGMAIPDDMCGCHRCDNPGCCNPAHIFAGTNAENTKDRDRKGRSAHGDTHWTRINPERMARGDTHWTRRSPERLAHNFGAANGMAYLTEDDVREIRRLYSEGGLSQQAIGKRYGMGQGSIGRIVRRDRWPNVA